MKIKNIINEAPTDLVARYYDVENEDDLNAWVDEYVDQNKEHYKKYFGDNLEDGNPVIIQPEEDPNNIEYTTKPNMEERPTPGFVGTIMAQDLANLPRDADL